MTDVALLIARARQNDPEAARALAELVEDRLLRRRGGDRQAITAAAGTRRFAPWLV